MLSKVPGVRPLAVGAVAVLILLHFQTTSAQTQPPATTPAPSVSPTTGASPSPRPSPSPTTSPSPSPTPTPTPKVLKVTGHLALYNTVSVEVENLAEYLKQPGKDPKKFILYLDWRPL